MLQLAIKVVFVMLAFCSFSECIDQDDVRHVCPHPPTLLHVTYVGLEEDYQPGDEVKWRCDVIHADLQHYDEVTGSLICTTNLRWSKPDPICACSHPGPIHHGGYILQNGSAYAAGNVAIGTTIDVRCSHGYIQLHRNNTCSSNGQWQTRGLCKRACPKITVRNGYYNFSAKEIPSWNFLWSYYLPGTTVKLVCYDGFRTLGEDELECDDSGKWLGFPRKCVPTCRAPRVPNGTFVDEKGLPLEHFDSGQSAMLICDVGYDVTPAGNKSDARHETIQCINHTWTGTLTCTASTPDVEVTEDIVQGRRIALILGCSIGGLLLIVSTLVFVFRRRIFPWLNGTHNTGEGTHTASDQGFPPPMAGNADDKMQTNGKGIQPAMDGHAGGTNTYVNTNSGPIYDNATFAKHSADDYEQPTSEHDSEEYMYARLQSDKDM